MSFETVHINQAQENNSDAALFSLPCKWSEIKIYKLKISGNMLPVLFGLKFILNNSFSLVIKKDESKTNTYRTEFSLLYFSAAQFFF